MNSRFRRVRRILRRDRSGRDERANEDCLECDHVDPDRPTACDHHHHHHVPLPWRGLLVGVIMLGVPTLLGLFYVAFVEPTESVHIGPDQCLEHTHYCSDSQGTIHWKPLPQCLLPPPKPLWLDGTGTAIKGIGIGLVFWTTISEPEPSCKNCWRPQAMEYGVIAFTVGSTFISICLLAVQVLTMEFDTYWEHFQCAGIVFSMAPWSANFLLYGAKSVAAEGLKRASGGNRGKERERMYQNIINASLLAFVAFNGVFTITNLIPGALVYFWVFVPAMMMAGGGLYIWDRQDKENYGSERGINMGPMLMIPVAIIIDLSIQWLATTSVYWYHGMGYFQAVWTSASERQSNIFIANVVQQVFMQAPWAVELVNEIAP